LFEGKVFEREAIQPEMEEGMLAENIFSSYYPL
jgi:hypothetical protein